MSKGCRNEEFTDREMLANIADAADADGWASSTDIGVQCGFSTNGKSRTPATRVASRLAWMRDGGLLESARFSDEDHTHDSYWRLTEVGQQILHGKLTKAVSGAIERMDAGAQILMMRELTRQGFVNGEVAVAFAIRREYQHNAAQRKLVLRGKS